VLLQGATPCATDHRVSLDALLVRTKKQQHLKVIVITPPGGPSEET
jgi:hypothetical protein